MTRALLFFYSIAAALAYVRNVTPGGIPLARRDASNIQFQVGPSVRAGALNADGFPVITAASDPAAALAAAAATWSGVPGSIVRFAPLQPALYENDPRDARQTITAADTPETRSLVGPYLAVTVWSYTDDGAMLDADVILNPALTEGANHVAFSTDHSPGTYDLESVVTHEFGHALGANHSGILSASMFQGTLEFSSFTTPAEATAQGTLSADDVAFLVAAYPAASAAPAFGRIAGTVRFDSGAPVRGALVTAVDADAGVAVGALAGLADGSYTISGIPPGRYQLYAQPLDGPVVPGSLGLASGSVDGGFRTTFFGGNGAPASLSVGAGGAAAADIVVDSAPSTMHIDRLGTAPVGGSEWAWASLKAIVSGGACDVLVWVRGIDSGLDPDQVRLLGPGVTLRPGSLRLQPDAAINGVVPLRMTVDVAPRDTRAQVSLAVVNGADAAANSAGLVLLPAPAP